MIKRLETYSTSTIFGNVFPNWLNIFLTAFLYTTLRLDDTTLTNNAVNNMYSKKKMPSRTCTLYAVKNGLSDKTH